MRSAHGTAAHGQILAEHVHGAAVHQAVAGDHARLGVQRVKLHKARGIQKKRDAFPGEQLPGLLLLFGELGIALQNREPAFANDGQIAFHTHVSSLHSIL